MSFRDKSDNEIAATEHPYWLHSCEPFALVVFSFRMLTTGKQAGLIFALSVFLSDSLRWTARGSMSCFEVLGDCVCP